MKKKYIVPNAAQQKNDINLMIGVNALAAITLFICSHLFNLSDRSVLLLLGIIGVWSAVVIRSLIKPLSAPEKLVDPLAGISASKRLDLIYVLKNIDIFDSAVDSRYPAFVRKYLKDMTPKKASAIHTLLTQLEPDCESTEESQMYRDMTYVYYMSAITIGAIGVTTSIMLILAGKLILLNLILGLAFLGGGLGYCVAIKKNKISAFFFMLGSAAVCAIIGGLLMK